MRSNVIENFIPLLPEMYLASAAFILLLFGVLRLKRVTPRMVMASVMVLAFVMWLVAYSMPPERIVVMNGLFLSDGYTAFAKILTLAGAALVLLASNSWLTENGGKPFEYLVLMLFAVLGMMLMISAQDLLGVYVGMELSALSLYVLAAFDRDGLRSSEAGLKYFVLGALASGMFLFGSSLVYGFTGTVSFDSLSQLFASFGDETGPGGAISKAAVIGLVLIIVAFCFKIAAVPFHMWSPDVYEGAPTPVTAFFALAPKISALLLLTRIMMQPFGDLFLQWQQVIVFASVASMLVGALAALRQTNIKRLLAYSGIGHIGFLLMGLAAGTASGVQAMLIYLITYIFMSAGAFGVILLMKRGGVYVETISDLAGLSRTRPWLAGSMAIFMFSMAGIPPLAGFFGKMYVVLAALESGLTPLAIVGLLTSVISCYYYLRVIKFMYFDEPAEAFDTGCCIPARIAISISGVATLLFFLVPGPLVAQAKAAAGILFR